MPIVPVAKPISVGVSPTLVAAACAHIHLRMRKTSRHANITTVGDTGEYKKPDSQRADYLAAESFAID